MNKSEINRDCRTQENIGKDKINKKVVFNHKIGMFKKQIYKIKNYI